MVSPRYGAILSLELDTEQGRAALLHPAQQDPSDVAPRTGGFPLLPFGNRIRGNQFRFEGQDYRLDPNVAWDRHVLHGDGWLADWQIEEVGANKVVLSFGQRQCPSTPYIYDAQQVVTLAEGCMHLDMSVTNRGAETLPFGIGWHPFFPSSARMTLQASTESYWGEDEDFLPTRRMDLPEELDFQTPRPLPSRWINNDFEGWDGRARIDWPERGLAIRIEADALFRHVFLFRPDTDFDPTYRNDFFCFEPMSHRADGHSAADGGGLRPLTTGETLSGRISLCPEQCDIQDPGHRAFRHSGARSRQETPIS